jgi:integrase
MQCCIAHYARQCVGNCSSVTQHRAFNCHASKIEKCACLQRSKARAFLRIALPSPHGCLFALALTTGMRPSEYLALCWQDVDWDHGTVSVVRSLHRSEGQWHFEDTKRVRSRRVVKLQDWVVGLLRKVRRETQAATAERDCDSTFSELSLPLQWVNR